MSESILWLLYLTSAAAAFAAIYRFGWLIVPSMLAGTAVTVAGWALLYALTDEETRPAFWQVDLSLNTCFALIFAAGGAAAGFALKYRRSD